MPLRRTTPEEIAEDVKNRGIASVQETVSPDQSNQSYKINPRYFSIGVQKASQHLKWWADAMPKVLAELIQKNPNLQPNNIKDTLLTFDRMEDDTANAIVKLIQQSMAE